MKQHILLSIFIYLSVSSGCLYAEVEQYNPLSLFNTFDSSLPAYGIDSAHQYQSIIHSMALGLYLKSAVILNKKLEAQNAAQQLLAIRYSKSKKEPGWGLGFAWDAFNNKKINPSHTIYGITVAICASGLFDIYDLTDEEQYKNVALEALDYYMEVAFKEKNELGFFYYSDSKYDKTYSVHNVTAMLMGQYARAWALTRDVKYKKIATSSMNYLWKEKVKYLNTYKWHYSSVNNSENDEAHAAFIVQGFLDYKKYVDLMLSIQPIVDFLKYKVSLMPTNNKYLWGAGQMIYTLTETGEKEFSEEIMLNVLPHFDLGDNHWSWKRHSQQEFLRHKAFLLVGLANYYSHYN